MGPWPACSSSTTRPRAASPGSPRRSWRGRGTTRSTGSRSSCARRWRRPPTTCWTADGYLLGTPANFGYMSGALKHFFDSTFLQVGGALSSTGAADESSGSTAGRPFGLYVHGRYDTAGAVRSVLSIVGALGWRQSAEVLEVLGDVTDERREAAYDLGGTLAALLSPG